MGVDGTQVYACHPPLPTPSCHMQQKRPGAAQGHYNMLAR